jgi:hypothetical protein
MAYPTTGVKLFDPKVDLQSVVLANDVNQVYSEVTAIETHLGAAGVAISSAWAGIEPDLTANKNWTTLNGRLVNIEGGVYKAITDRVDVAGGDTITSSATGVVGLEFRLVNSQTANPIQVTNAAGTGQVFYVTPTGKVVASSINGGTP